MLPLAPVLWMLVAAGADRVVVLGDADRPAIQRRVARIVGHSDLVFRPTEDLVQFGRVLPSLRAYEQPGVLPTDGIERIEEMVRFLPGIQPWIAFDEADWDAKADQMRALEDEVLWFLDDPDLRKPRFDLYIQISRAYEESGRPDDEDHYAHLAAQLVEPDFTYDLFPDQLRALEAQQARMQAAEPVAISFAAVRLEDSVVRINGIAVDLDEDAVFHGPPGRYDVSVETPDGPGLALTVDDSVAVAEQVEDVRVRLTANLSDRQTCAPPVEPDLWRSVGTYGALHPHGELYVAVPGPRTEVYRYNRYYGVFARLD